jgi:hypothetical protein
MHPRLAELLAYVESEHRRFVELIATIPKPARLQRPSATQWSAGEVTEHLAIVEGRVAGRVRDQVAAARAAGSTADPDTSAIIPQLGLERVWQRTDRLQAPEAIHPVGVTDADVAMARLEEAHQQFVASVRAADGVNLALLSMPHPVFGPLSMYHWIGFSGAHKRRHAMQVEDVVTSLARMGA